MVNGAAIKNIPSLGILPRILFGITFFLLHSLTSSQRVHLITKKCMIPFYSWPFQPSLVGSYPFAGKTIIHILACRVPKGYGLRGVYCAVYLARWAYSSAVIRDPDLKLNLPSSIVELSVKLFSWWKTKLILHFVSGTFGQLEASNNSTFILHKVAFFFLFFFCFFVLHMYRLNELQKSYEAPGRF